MASIMSDYLEQKLLDHICNATTYSPPAAVYLALYTTTGEGGTEVTGGSYARQAVSFGAATITGQITNDATISFPAMPACTVRAAALVDALSGGHQLFWWNLSSAKTYVSGDNPTVSINNLIITLD